MGNAGSKNAAGNRPPSWKAFLESGIEKCPAPKKEMKSYLKSGDFLTCCYLIKHKMGQNNWENFLDEHFLKPKFEHHEIHENIFNLDSSIVITPNFDKIYDTYALKETNNLLKIKKYHEDDIARCIRGSGDSRLIIKIHGCIDTPGKVIFTREDYAEIRSKYANIYRAIESLIVTHTFLFVGCGMNDPDLALLLEQYAHSFASAPPHYLLMGKKVSLDYKNMLLKNYNVILIEYSAKNDHEELTNSLKDLGERVDIQRQSIANSRLW